MKKLISIIFISTIITTQLFSQDNEPVNWESHNIKPFTSEGFVFDYAKITAGGLISNNNNLPFWMHTNTHGRINPQSNGFALAQGSVSYYFSERSYIEVGAGLVASDGNEDDIHRDELYVSYNNKWLKATLGSKTPFQKYQGLSTVARDFLISGNARSLPGLILEASQPLKLSESFQIDWGIAHYSLNDTRFTDDARIHYKRLGLVYNLDSKSSFSAGLEHYAQWGGASTQFGEQPGGLDDFIDVFLARRAGENAAVGDILNSLGNHLGIYNFEYNFTPSTGRFSFYHQHPFEDGSGTALKNFPDGIWGFYFGPNTKDYTTFITGVLLEYIQTTDQSGATGETGSGGDYYFSNGVYRSGWTYHGNTIGLPFITPQNDANPASTNNRTRGLHFGLAAARKNVSFKLKASFVENLGTFEFPFDPKQQAIYSSFFTTYTHEQLGAVSVQLGYDYNDLTSDNLGAAIFYTYNF